MKIIRQYAYARAGLMGNPTDGYGGKTISFTMRDFAALAVLYPWEHVEILWSRQDRNRFRCLDDLIEDVELNGYYGGVRLVKATIKRFVEYCRKQGHRLHQEPFSIRYDTHVPRGVGLAGSSAIVVATLRCLMQFYEVEIPEPVQASLARSVENDELDIACGYQDRVAQIYEGLVYMDFGDMREMQGYQVGRYERLDASLLPPLYIVYDLAAAKTSSSVHAPLRAQVQSDERRREVMMQIAALVPQAREALTHRDYDQLHELINRNFDLRTKLYHIAPHHQQMIETARRAGASAKFAGSGGAIVGSYRDEEMFERLKQEMAAANPMWRVIKPEIV